MQDFRKLRVWQFSQDLTVDLYRCTSTFPREELFGITGQIRRASVSVGSNIAEGAKREWSRDKARFFNISQGSAGEGISLLDVSRRLGYLQEKQAASLTDRFDHIAAMLELLREAVKQGG